MTIAQGGLSAGAALPEFEFARRLILVAIGWILLAMIPPALAGLARGLAIGFVRGLTHGASELQIPPTLGHFLTSAGALGIAAVLLYAASVRGRIVGGGDTRLGLGIAPITKLPTVIGLSTVLVLYAALITFSIYTYRPDLFFQSASVNPWLTLFDSLWLVIAAPLAEELFFRGWLWTGLRKQWGGLLTGLVTAGMWLILHLDRGIGYVVLLVFPALILTIARLVGKSVQATVPMHAVYNLTANIPLIVLVLKLFHS